MNWTDAETAIRSHVETQWALGAYASMPLVWENEDENVEDMPEPFMVINIEGTYSDKTIFGSAGKRSSIEAGIVFYHAFTQIGAGKALATGPVVSMGDILQLQVISQYIDMDGSNPPSPVYSRRDELDREIINQNQPMGNYYRCSGSVPFIIRSSI